MNTTRYQYLGVDVLRPTRLYFDPYLIYLNLACNHWGSSWIENKNHVNTFILQQEKTALRNHGHFTSMRVIWSPKRPRIHRLGRFYPLILSLWIGRITIPWKWGTVSISVNQCQSVSISVNPPRFLTATSPVNGRMMPVCRATSTTLWTALRVSHQRCKWFGRNKYNLFVSFLQPWSH